MTTKKAQAIATTACCGAMLAFSGAAVAAVDSIVPVAPIASADYEAPVASRGTTIEIPESVIASLCGDFDGCSVRLGMYNWDGTGRTASRESLLYYNTSTRTWRASAGDPAGMNFNAVTEHIIQAWACYFTDGSYSAWTNYGDYSSNFGLLSWNQYTAACRLSIID
jgi:hypothetical protein